MRLVRPPAACFGSFVLTFRKFQYTDLAYVLSRQAWRLLAGPAFIVARKPWKSLSTTIVRGRRALAPGDVANSSRLVDEG